jgi:hypothetical protein
MPPVGFEATISAGERPQIALDRAATGTGTCEDMELINVVHNRSKRRVPYKHGNAFFFVITGGKLLTS